MSSIIVDYFKPEMRTRTLKRLGLLTNAFYEKLIYVTNATDEKTGERLINLHYNPEKLERLIEINKSEENSEKYKKQLNVIKALSKIRGVIFDLNIMEPKVQSFPRTILIQTDSVPLDRLLPIPTENGEFIIPKDGRYKKCYPGTLLRFFYHNGKTRPSTHRKIDATGSFFGDSDKFGDIWLKDQDVFPNYDSLYENHSDDVIHLFIINNRKLIVDSREIQDIDRVVYIKSYSMTDHTKVCDLTNFIIEKNKTATKPIEICKVYTPEEVNLVLKGEQICQSDTLPGISSINTSLLSLFSGGEKVIYENSEGTYTLVPSSCFFRQRIMDGKVNISKLFVDSISDYERNSKGLIKIGFPLDSLEEIAQLILDGEPIDISKYTMVENMPQLVILTNLIFIVPISRIRECFTAYHEFDSKIKEAIECIIERKTDLLRAILNEELDTYEGMSSVGIKFKKYLIDKLPYVRRYREGPFNHWPESAKDLYKEYYARYCQSDSDDIKIEMEEYMGIISLICNSTDDVLYAFTTYKAKIQKEKDLLNKKMQY